MRQFLDQLQDLSIYPVLAFLIFFGFFLGVVAWSIWAPKRYINEMKHLPLQDDADPLPTPSSGSPA
jgi:cbb3-type cytochrome oxidase subunit 3